MGKLNIQKYLETWGQPERLSVDFGIRVYRHPNLPLIGFKYNQIESPKTHPVVRESRGLVLEDRSWKIVAKPFNRFFNVGEVAEEFKQFDWSDFTAYDKEDGSLTILYHYEKEWHVNTSGSFGLSIMSSSVNFTWRELFWKAAPFSQDDLDKAQAQGLTLIFELCSPYNKIVRTYRKPTVYLLSVFDRKTCRELTCQEVDILARELEVNRPQRHYFQRQMQIAHYIQERSMEDGTWEGLVLKDQNGLRFKWKTPAYLVKHRIKDNGNILNPKNLLPIVLGNEQAEYKVSLPEISSALDTVHSILHEAQKGMIELWEAHKHEEYQKNFANRVKHHPLACVMFKLRKKNPLASPQDIARELRAQNDDGSFRFVDTLLKSYFKGVSLDYDILEEEEMSDD